MTTRFLTPDELAALLAVSPKTIEKWRWSGAGPEFVRLPSRAIRYPASAVEQWLAARVARSTSDRGAAEATP